MALPAPSGPFSIGTIELAITDAARPRHLGTDAAGRRLRLKLWYPAQPAGQGVAGERVWEELRRDTRTPLLARLLLAMLRTRAAAFPGAPQVASPPRMRPLLYHHGLVSFASENGSLMEDLASRGRMVVAMAHLDQLAELQTLQRAQPAALRRQAAALATRLARADAAGKAALAREYYEASVNTSRIILERAADTAFVLRQWDTVLAAIPGRVDASTTTRSPVGGVHLAGFSLGGAVATAVAAEDARVRAVVNLDGGTQGPIDASAIRAACLMLYSEANQGINDALLPAGARRETAAGTRHLNFHDMAGLVPALRFTPALGTTDPSSFLRTRNHLVATFLQAQDG